MYIHIHVHLLACTINDALVSESVPDAVIMRCGSDSETNNDTTWDTINCIVTEQSGRPRLIVDLT